MKTFKITLLSLLAVASIVGCAHFGANPSPPNKFEEGLFDVQHSTNATTGRITQELTTNQATKDQVSLIGEILGLFIPGAKGAATTGLLALLAAYGHLRSSKGARTSEALSQEIETALTFVGSLPNGEAYRKALGIWLSDHQKEVGLADSVATLIKEKISKKSAQDALTDIQDLLKALQAKS